MTVAYAGDGYDPDELAKWILLALAVLSTYCDLVGVLRG
jgi:hypothetical protein